MKRIFLLISVILISAAGCYADCIMNSTEFYKAYLDVPLVNKAHQNKNNFTNEHKKYLMNENNPLDIRMAIVNAFDWDHEGDYYRQFMDYLKNAPGKLIKQIFINKTNNHEKANNDYDACFGGSFRRFNQ